MKAVVREGELPTIESMAELVELVDSRGQQLYVRWSKGPDVDQDSQSRDDLTGVELPGLSASALAVEDWWHDRSLELWVARRLHDYRHLRERRDARPWLMVGREIGRGPDNEPLVSCEEAVAWIGDELVDEAVRLIDDQATDWGTLDRAEG
jgi:hypothetical protein